MPHYQFGVSVVIPSYNRTIEVVRAINSVETSTPDLVEIIIVDDCSSLDPSSFISAENSTGVPIRYFRFKRNRGPQAARNLGIRRAKFNHIAFLDSDDVFTKDKIDLMLSEIRKDPADIIFHSVIGLPRYRSLILSWSKYFKAFIPFHWLIVLFNPIITPSLIIKKQRKLGVEKFRYSEDWCYLMRYIDRETTIRYVDVELSEVYRIAGSEGGLSTSFWKMRRGEFAARKILLRNCTPANLVRFFVGSLAGLLRIGNDTLLGRYWK